METKVKATGRKVEQEDKRKAVGRKEGSGGNGDQEVTGRGKRKED